MKKIFLIFLLFIKVTILNIAQITLTYDPSGNLTQKTTTGNIPPAGIQAPGQVCWGDQVQLTASGGTSYQWSTGATTPGIQIQAFSPEIYTVTVTTNDGCETIVEHALAVYDNSASPYINGDRTPLAEPDAPAAIYEVEAHTGSTYDWQITGGTLQSGFGSPMIQVKWTDDYDGSISLVESNDAGCNIGSSLLNLQMAKRQNIDLNGGWNLISYYVQHEDPDIPVVFNSVAGPLERVKDEFGTYYHGQDPVFNSLDEVVKGQGYWVRVSDPATISTEGIALKPETVAIPLAAAPSWNLIGYPCQSPQAIEDALANIMPFLVQVKDIDNFYDPTFPPVFNDLTELEPGKGYWIKVNTPLTLYFPRPDPPGLIAEIPGVGRGDLPSGWERIAYPNSMSAGAWATLDGERLSEDDVIGVFAGEECRAINTITNTKDSSYLALVINGTGPEELQFKLFKNGRIYTSTFQTTLERGRHLPELLPLTFFSDLTGTEALQARFKFQVQPNPVTDKLLLSFTLPSAQRVQLRAYDAKGSLVKDWLIDQTLAEGEHQFHWAMGTSGLSAGTYLIQATIGTEVLSEKVVLIR